MGHAPATTSRLEGSSQRQDATFSASVVSQALHVSDVYRNLNEKDHHQVFSSCDAGQEQHFDAFHASAISGCPEYSKVLNSSKLVRVKARVNNHLAHSVTIDTAADEPCISATFAQTHPTIKYSEILRVPAGAINISSADG